MRLSTHSVLVLSVFSAAWSLNACRARNSGNSSAGSFIKSVSQEGIPFEAFFDLQPGTELAGKTYLAFMNQDFRPAMEKIYDNGYRLVGSEGVQLAYDLSDLKVRKKVDRLWGGLDSVKATADRLVTRLRDKTVTMDSLPKMVNNNFGLATFLGLASGGGVKVQYAPGNIAYNVHYAKTNQQSGRSFGTGPRRGANDASDKQYLDDLAEYGKNLDIPVFYGSLIRTVLALDTSAHTKLSPLGQAVLTDFLAVYTAEQARNLMDGQIKLHWDAALLEVTLLSAFHSGQSKFALFYKNPKTKQTNFTSNVLPQTSGCDVANLNDNFRQAKMSDYWQFSANPEKPNCTRSGINITRNEFRRLGMKITSYMISKHKAEYTAVANAVEEPRSRNLFESLSAFILLKAGEKKQSKAKVEELATAWIEFLTLTREEADKISQDASGGGLNVESGFRPSAEEADQVSGGFDVLYEEDAAVAQ